MKQVVQPGGRALYSVGLKTRPDTALYPSPVSAAHVNTRAAGALRSSVPAAVADHVAQACLTDALDAFGLNGRSARLTRHVLGRALAGPVQRLADEIVTFDRDVAAAGLRYSARRALPYYARGITVQGCGHVPEDGPLLVVANHPGLADALALFAHLPRADLRVIAAHRRLLCALPATAAHLVTMPADAVPRLAPLREAIGHLRCGGALLTFPAGRIEPDPAHRDNAPDSLAHWSSCIDVFARRVPGLNVVPAAIGGVLSSTACAHPLTRLRRHPRDRDWLAATLQMLDPRLRDVNPQVAFGAPMSVRLSPGRHDMHEATQAAMRSLLMQVGAGVA